ncbi:MAG: helicase-related protein [Armatimonadota bacterium]|jgi:hypothetical protein
MRDLLTPEQVEDVLAPLKDFQRRTVDYAFERLFRDGDGSRRFLVADEVGLGKTLVARGVTARAIEHLQSESVERIDIVYVCSNMDIVRQNLNRLNFLEDVDADALCTRITLMPMQVSELNSRRVNMLGLTPGTSFDLRSNTGQAMERALIWRMLDSHWKLSGNTCAFRAFKCTCKPENWEWWINHAEEYQIDVDLENAFVERVLSEAGLHAEFECVCSDFRKRSQQWEVRHRRNRLISRLRLLLATVCVHALKPDLIILDEFQRYRRIIDGTDDETMLAHELLNWEDVRLLLLSATPYKMYTGSAEDEDHYDDFIAVSRFLLNGDEHSVTELQEGLGDFRRGLYGARHSDLQPLRDARDRVEAQLRRVMVRNERGRAVEEELVCDADDGPVPVGPGDLQDYALFDRVGEAVKGPAPVDYWKSAPYLLNVMDGSSYKLKRQLSDQLENGRVLTSMPEGALLRRRDIEDYAGLDPRNGRLRALIRDTLDNEAWRLLWIPPALPYYRTDSVYDRPELRDFTKRLVFSSWGMVPRAIATLCSYEAERRMMAEARDVKYSEATRSIARLLEFAREGDRLTGMPVLGTLYPCITLAMKIDPLKEALAASEQIDLREVQTEVEAQVRELLEPIVRHEAAVGEKATGRADESWYWAALALLDRKYGGPKSPARAWLDTKGDWQWERLLHSDGEEDDAEDGFSEHVERFRQCFAGKIELGPPPDDLYEVIAQIALAGPGVVAVRSLLRQIPGFAQGRTQIMASAARIALGFRTLFNLHEVRSMLRPTGVREDTPYWRIVLEHCAAGHLQAVMDEYVHVLRESMGLIDAGAVRVAHELSNEITEVLSLGAATLRLDEFEWRSDSGLRHMGDMGVRCRYALRFGDLRSEDRTVARRGDVRQAFNSPFRPFILATTSIGQEGLDFHLYCHSVCHWNLPSNPVDLEQREGRINRYKCHAIRRSVARDLGLTALSERNGDPWQALFAAAEANRGHDQTELVPWWVYDGPGSVKIQRIVPMLPLSRETQRLPALKEALAAYRLVFGQPRQEDLLDYILDRLDGDEIDREALRRCQIDLSPR